MIGHIHECEENYTKAASALKSAVELAPEYNKANYDYSKYCAQVGDIKNCLSYLEKAITDNSVYRHLSKKEKNFMSVRRKVDNLLKSLE